MGPALYKQSKNLCRISSASEDAKRRSGVKCAVANCGMSKRSNPSCRLFRLPWKDRGVAKVWIKNCQLKVEKDSRVFICDKHFDSSCFGRKYLFPGKVPTLELPVAKRKKVTKKTTNKIKSSPTFQYEIIKNMDSCDASGGTSNCIQVLVHSQDKKSNKIVEAIDCEILEETDNECPIVRPIRSIKPSRPMCPQRLAHAYKIKRNENSVYNSAEEIKKKTFEAPLPVPHLTSSPSEDTHYSIDYNSKRMRQKYESTIDDEEEEPAYDEQPIECEYLDELFEIEELQACDVSCSENNDFTNNNQEMLVTSNCVNCIENMEALQLCEQQLDKMKQLFEAERLKVRTFQNRLKNAYAILKSLNSTEPCNFKI